MTIYPRNLEGPLRQVAGYYPVVTVTGPRQSGKTTLCRSVFPEKPYVSLEAMDERAFARDDPRGFLARFPDGAILDEIQYAPDLLSYLQVLVDERPSPGQFILTGSQQFGLTAQVAQSLAGRSGLLSLLPLALDELRRFPGHPTGLLEAIRQGAYPRIFAQGIPAERWLADYAATYVERDVRSLLNIGDLNVFQGFLKLAAGRTAQVLNQSDLGADAGIAHNTARAWLSVLEASFIAKLVPAWHRNLSKQVAKAPKLHLLDSGLACYLLGIRRDADLETHPLRGALFESWVASELLKQRANRGLDPNLYHLRRPRGEEVDLVIDASDALHAIEVKSGSTVPDNFLRQLDRASATLVAAAGHRPLVRSLVYGGDQAYERSGVRVIPWHQVAGVGWGE